MPVSHLELALLPPLHHPARHEIELLVVVVGHRRQKHLQPFCDNQVRANHQHGVQETPVLPFGDLIDDLPDDNHGHHDGLARTGGHLAGTAGEAVFLGESDAPPLGGRGFHQPVKGLGRFPLAEGELALLRGIVPVGYDLPGDGSETWIAMLAPLLDSQTR